MLRLNADVGHDCNRVRLADGECAVAGLPMEISELGTLGFDPFGGTGFHSFHDLGDGAGAGKPEEKVNVVFNAAHLQGRAFDVVEYSSKVGMQFGLEGGREDVFAIFGAEDQMDEDAG